MLVGVNQLAGTNLSSKHLDFTIPANRARVGVADAGTSRKRFETGCSHLVGIANSSVDDCAHAAESAVEIAGDFAPERTVKVRFVEILHDHDLRSRERCDVPAILAPGVGMCL